MAKYLGGAVDQVRRAEHKVLKKEGHERLTGSRYFWLQSEENLSEKQSASFEDLQTAKLTTGRAWTLKEIFRQGDLPRLLGPADGEGRAGIF